MQTITHIFGGEAKVKIMRLFIFNPAQIFSPREVAIRAKERPIVVRREIRNLSKAGLLRKRGRGYILNGSYPYLSAIENFLIDATPITPKEIVNRLAKVGNIKLILIAGVFLHDKDSRADILVVGDNLKQGRLSTTMSRIEAELGKEIRYAVFEAQEFKYRLAIYDKLIRDILDHPHQKILNKLGI
jgi:hypothetical protein